MHSKYEEWCAFEIRGVVCIQNMRRGVHTLDNMRRGVHTLCTGPEL